MIQSFFSESIIKRAIEKELVQIEVVDIRSFATDKYRTVDDKPYGGGVGMVMKIEPVIAALRSVVSATPAVPTRVLMTSAKGAHYNQAKAKELAQLEQVVILCGHYEGIDDRVTRFIDEEVSIGDFVMTGGEIAAAAITDSIVRLQNGVLKKETATAEESFYTVPLELLIKAVGPSAELTHLKEAGRTSVQLLEYPHYTRPEEFEGLTVPEVLLGGNHAEIEKWRLQQAFKETLKKRPDLLQ
jgi:tRNA (guanine37-N1)-methyltransferase